MHEVVDRVHSSGAVSITIFYFGEKIYMTFVLQPYLVWDIRFYILSGGGSEKARSPKMAVIWSNLKLVV